MQRKYQLTGIGTAILDVISYKDPKFINDNELVAGSMKLIDFETSKSLYEKLGSATECAGGSTANTLAAFAMFGGRSAFIGKTQDDFGGRVFKKEMEKVGCDFICNTTDEGLSTSKCLIMVSEEEGFAGRKRIERTMATYLDSSVIVGEQDITEEVIKNSEIIIAEGYLFDNKKSRAAVLKSIEIAKANGVKVAFTLSDPFCVQRHKEDFLKVVKQTDILFANEHEANALYDADDIKRTIHKFTGTPGVKCITMGENGSNIIWNDKIHPIEPVKVPNVYDVTGAGDCYAAGFLYAYAQGNDADICGKVASACAAEVIQYLGGRPVTDLTAVYDKIIKF